MTIKEQIKIIQAYERGEDIDWKSKYNSDKGFLVPNYSNYQFDFRSFEYRIKPKRWRAKEKEMYYWINFHGEVMDDNEYFSEKDNDCYDRGNYFRTREDAEKAAELVKECLMKFHEENGKEDYNQDNRSKS